MKRLGVWWIIITIALLVGLSLLPIRAAEVPRPTEAERFNFWIMQCFELKGEDAVIACDEAITIYPEDIVSWYGRFKALLANGREQEADWSFARVQILQYYYQAITQVLSQREQVQAFIQGDESLERLQAQIDSGEIEGEQLEQLQNIRKDLLEFRENPAALEELTGETMLQLRTRFDEAIEQLNVAKP